MAEAAYKRATYEDVWRVPAHKVAELVDGVLHTHPRPAAKHARAASRLGMELGPPFDNGDDGPGDWIILDEPELHFAEDIVVPDLAGWRKQRMPTLPDVAFFELPPDWICEVLSHSTAAFDRSEKLPIYAREGVKHAWLIDPSLQTLEVLDPHTARNAPRWQLLHTFQGQDAVRAEPFDALPLRLDRLWS